MLKSETARRKQILQTASRIFHEKTYHGTTLQDIADAVGMLKGSIYYYFNSKKELLDCILLDALAVIDNSLEQIAGADLSPPEKLRAIIRAHARFNTEYQEATTLFLTERNTVSSLFKVELIKSRKRGDELLVRILEEGIRAGVYQCQDVKLAARIIAGMCNSSAFWYRASGTHSHEEIADLFFQFLHYGLAVRA